MTDSPKRDDVIASAQAPNSGRDLSAAAKRALAEAEERRARCRAEEAARPKELGGRGGHDPERYGDWEIKGLTSDF